MKPGGAGTNGGIGGGTGGAGDIGGAGGDAAHTADNSPALAHVSPHSALTLASNGTATTKGNGHRVTDKKFRIYSSGLLHRVFKSPPPVISLCSGPASS
eukprot:6143106-Prymnesium_polylepis.1